MKRLGDRQQKVAWLNFATAFLVGALRIGAAVTDAGAQDAATVYKAWCARCHGESGKSDTPEARALKVRPFVHDPKFAKMALADIVHAIRSNPKHRDMGAMIGLEDSEVGAAAVFVKELASKR